MVTPVTTVTTVTTITAMGLTATISIAAIVSLILFLACKEITGASRSGSYLRIARFLNVAILPLVMAFAVIVAVKIASILLA